MAAKKTLVRLGIQRTLNTAKYESIVITREQEEEIYWQTAEEKEKKTKEFEVEFVNKYKEGHDEVLKELKLSHKMAYFVHPIEEKDHRAEPGEKHEFDDIFLDNADELQ